MNWKKGIAVAMVLTASAYAAFFLARPEIIDTRVARKARQQRVAPTLATTTATTTRPGMISSLTIDGTVIGSEPWAGTLTLRVGSTVSTQPISVVPDYSFVVNGAQSTDMVSLEIETQNYRFASLLGSYAKLRRLAGSDGRLSATELDRVRVSPFSTALYFFIQRELGRLPVSDAEHELAIRSLSGYDLTTGAYWLETFAQDPTTLPQGFANGFALLQNRDAYRAFVNQNGGGGDPMSLPSVPILPSQLGRNTLLLGPVPRKEVVMFNPGVRIISRTATGWDSYAGARENPRFSASFLPSGEFKLTAQGEPASYVLVTRRVDPSQTAFQATERRQFLSETYRQVFVGERYSLWAINTQWTASYPDFPWVASREAGMTELAVASRLDDQIPLRFRSGEMLGERALPVLCKMPASSSQPTLPSRLEYCESAVQRFYSDGSGYVESIGPKVDSNGQPVAANGFLSFHWSAGRTGPLEIAYHEGASTVSATHWRIDHGNEAVDTMVYVARSQNGSDMLTIAGLTGMIKADLAGDFTDTSPEGTWRYGSFDINRPLYAYSQNDPPFDITFERYADGTSARKDTYYYDPPEGPYHYTIRFGWQLLDGQLYEARYRANVATGVPDTTGFSSCASAYQLGATQCGPYQIRYFRPLARLGNRLYGLQEVYTLQGSNYSAPYTWLRGATVNYFQKQ